MRSLVECFKHYQEDLPDSWLIEEAICTIEQYTTYFDDDYLQHRFRPLAIAYLALCYAEKALKEQKSNV